MDVGIEIKRANRVGLRFDQFPDALYDGLREEIESLTNELFALVKASTPVHTGKLQSQVRVRVFADKNRIKGLVDVAGAKGTQDFAKAAALEYGAHRPAKVRAHSMRLDHVFDEKLNAPLTVLVAAYTRTPDIEEHAFERGPLHEMQPEITARLNAVVEKTAAAAND